MEALIKELQELLKTTSRGIPKETCRENPEGTPGGIWEETSTGTSEIIPERFSESWKEY